jgi:FkbM family methyltransferase
MFSRARQTALNIFRELNGTWRLAEDASSFARFAGDTLAYRAPRVFSFPDPDRHRTSRLRDGTRLRYRLNRGDLRAVAESWILEAYELPFEIHPRNILDLGANIGATGAWFLHRYGGSRIVAVEPVRENAELARINLGRMSVESEVVTAAVAATEGIGKFALSDNSMIGRLGVKVSKSKLATPAYIIYRFPDDERIDLVKMDIEGAEEEIFGADVGWLERVDCVVLELHSGVSSTNIIATLQRLGFNYHPLAADNHYCCPTDFMTVFHRR